MRASNRKYLLKNPQIKEKITNYSFFKKKTKSARAMRQRRIDDRYRHEERRHTTTLAIDLGIERVWNIHEYVTEYNPPACIRVPMKTYCIMICDIGILYVKRKSQVKKKVTKLLLGVVSARDFCNDYWHIIVRP